MKKPESLIEVENLEKKGKIIKAVKMWDNEYSRLREEKNKAKNDDTYWEISKKMAHINDKLHWAKTEPEIREVELKVRREIDLEEKEIAAFTEGLTRKEQDVRICVMTLLTHCGAAARSCIRGTREEVENQQQELEKRAIKLMKDALEVSNGDMDLIKKVFHPKDIFKFPLFKQLYNSYKKGDPLVGIFAHYENENKKK